MPINRGFGLINNTIQYNNTTVGAREFSSLRDQYELIDVFYTQTNNRSLISVKHTKHTHALTKCSCQDKTRLYLHSGRYSTA